MSKHFTNNLLDLISFTSEARQIPNFFVLIYIAIRSSIAILQRIAIHTYSRGGGYPTANSLPSLSHWIVLVAEQWKQSMVGELR